MMTMRTLSAILAGLCAVAAAGCTVVMPSGERRVQYLCDTGQVIEMRFFPEQGVGVLVRDGQTIELQQQPSGSGFIYSNGPNTVRGKGDELMLEIGRMSPIACRTR